MNMASTQQQLAIQELTRLMERQRELRIALFRLEAITKGYKARNQDLNPDLKRRLLDQEQEYNDQDLLKARTEGLKNRYPLWSVLLKGNAKLQGNIFAPMEKDFRDLHLQHNSHQDHYDLLVINVAILQAALDEVIAQRSKYNTRLMDLQKGGTHIGNSPMIDVTPGDNGDLRMANARGIPLCVPDMNTFSTLMAAWSTHGWATAAYTIQETQLLSEDSSLQAFATWIVELQSTILNIQDASASLLEDDREEENDSNLSPIDDLLEAAWRTDIQRLRQLYYKEERLKLPAHGQRGRMVFGRWAEILMKDMDIIFEAQHSFVLESSAESLESPAEARRLSAVSRSPGRVLARLYQTFLTDREDEDVPPEQSHEASPSLAPSPEDSDRSENLEDMESFHEWLDDPKSVSEDAREGSEAPDELANLRLNVAHAIAVHRIRLEVALLQRDEANIRAQSLEQDLAAANAQLEFLRGAPPQGDLLPHLADYPEFADCEEQLAWVQARILEYIGVRERQREQIIAFEDQVESLEVDLAEANAALKRIYNQGPIERGWVPDGSGNPPPFANCEKQLAWVQARILEYTKEQETLRQQIPELQNCVEEPRLQENRAFADLRRQVEALQTEVAESQRLHAASKAENADKIVVGTRLTDQLIEMEDFTAELFRERDRLAQTVHDLRQQVDRYSEEIGLFRASEDFFGTNALRRELQLREEKFAEIEARLVEVTATHNGLQTRNGVLEEQTAEQENDAQGLRRERDTAIAQIRELVEQIANLSRQVRNIAEERDTAFEDYRELRVELKALSVQHPQEQEGPWAQLLTANERLRAVTSERDEALAKLEDTKTNEDESKEQEVEEQPEAEVEDDKEEDDCAVKLEQALAQRDEITLAPARATGKLGQQIDEFQRQLAGAQLKGRAAATKQGKKKTPATSKEKRRKVPADQEPFPPPEKHKVGEHPLDDDSDDDPTDNDLVPPTRRTRTTRNLAPNYGGGGGGGGAGANKKRKSGGKQGGGPAKKTK